MKNTDDILRKTAINTLGLLLDRAQSRELREKIIGLQSTAANPATASIHDLVSEIAELKKKLRHG
jgi:hypothetical protein